MYILLSAVKEKLACLCVYAVTTEFEVVASGSLPLNDSEQAAELVALTEACKLMAGKCITIYTDSRYSFGFTHDFEALWKCRIFLSQMGAQ